MAAIVGSVRSAIGLPAGSPRLSSAPARARHRDRRVLRLGGRDQWSKAGPLLEHAQPGYLALAFATVAAYYLVFILGWMRILDAWDIRIPYRIALQSEMVSMLAKYMPGGVWTPAARTLALRRSARRDRHADRARVDPRRGGAVGDLRA